jgi:hypothetical protein
MPVQIQIRRGTAAEWTAANPVLAAGELGLETDGPSFKIGDGATAWTTLAYASGTPGAPGDPGVGIPTGGATGQRLAKIDGTDYNTEWVTPSADGLVDEGAFTYLDAIDAAAPADPSTGHARIYAKAGRIYSRDSGGVEYGPFDAAGGGSSAGLTLVQTKYSGPTGTTIVMDAAPIAGHTLLLGLNRLGTSTTSAVSSDNTTWTMLLQRVAGGSCMELWVGICGASPGDTITFTAGTSGYNSKRVIEIAESLAGTVGVTYAATLGLTGTVHTLAGVTVGNVVFAMGTNVDTGVTTQMAPDYVASVLPSTIGLRSGIVVMFAELAVATSVAAFVPTTSGTDILMAEVS